MKHPVLTPMYDVTLRYKVPTDTRAQSLTLHQVLATSPMHAVLVSLETYKLVHEHTIMSVEVKPCGK
jgi:hypothetical protein